MERINYLHYISCSECCTNVVSCSVLNLIAPVSDLGAILPVFLQQKICYVLLGYDFARREIGVRTVLAPKIAIKRDGFPRAPVSMSTMSLRLQQRSKYLGSKLTRSKCPPRTLLLVSIEILRYEVSSPVVERS